MSFVWYCQKCKKVVKKKPKKIGNTFYIPDTVSHKHGNVIYVLTCITLEEYMTNPYFKGY